MTKFLVTGAAGFIGSFLCNDLLKDKNNIVFGVDNMNHYYDVGIKEDRLRMLNESINSENKFVFQKGDIGDEKTITEIFRTFRPEVVVNLAAQAGVRHSIDNPHAYIESNIVGFFNILEACRHYPVKHLVYASSSSVYGSNEKVPYSVADNVDNPVSLYAATKKSNELMAHAYSKLYAIPVTGLRFFTVYGPMGRPDMAYFKFTDKLVKGEPIQVYNMGDMWRDFTYIDDIIKGLSCVIQKAPSITKDGARSKIYNIGNSSPESLMHFVETLEHVLQEEGIMQGEPKHELLPMQPGDVFKTYADVSDLEKDFGFTPATSLEDGLRRFVQWYKKYYKL